MANSGFAKVQSDLFWEHVKEELSVSFQATNQPISSALVTQKVAGASFGLIDLISIAY